MTVSLDDRWNLSHGTVLMTGTQAIARIFLDQAARDRTAGLRTAGFISGYRGSPLGGVDSTLWSIRDRLSTAKVTFQPGVNEELAATAVRGTQQAPLLPKPLYDGVFAAWYGKGPGVDRALDALKHGNFAGASAQGGVLCIYGDDHAGKSSTVAHQSEQALASSLIPSLYPANVEELRYFGLLGLAMSRYSGAWVGIKCVNEVVEQTMTVDLDPERDVITVPEYPDDAPPEVHLRFLPYNPLRDERTAFEARLPLVHRFVRANRIDRCIFEGHARKLGIVTAGKSYGDVLDALRLLGLDETAAAAMGISLYKIGCIWPLEPEGARAFADGHDTLLVIEEKKSFIEAQLAEMLFNNPDRPLMVGKLDTDGRPLLSSVDPLDPGGIARVIRERLYHLGVTLEAPRENGTNCVPPTAEPIARRIPYFCSGCPHNRSTKLPTGSMGMAGIGCHSMVTFTRPEENMAPTQMGGEGANWFGIAPFSGTRHMFQNLGDGTYYHSGSLAVRAAVAAGVNITYKILYNDAVAMTGGQPVDGPISVLDIVRQMLAERVAKVVLLSEFPDAYSSLPVPAGVEVRHRDDLDAVQRMLRETEGTTILIYDQTCAAEKRRRRKRGKLENPAQRYYIAPAVCEGCGDCSVQSTCVSIQPLATPLGTKRRIDQTSCNKDFSCAKGFCPSFITIRGAEPRRQGASGLAAFDPSGLPPAPKEAVGGNPVNIMLTGIGGTGVVTAAALIAMAARLDGLNASAFDMTGLAQKNGAVLSHLRIVGAGQSIAAQRIPHGKCDLLIAIDMVAALGDDAATTYGAQTCGIANASVASTAAFQFNRDFTLDKSLLARRLSERTDGKLNEIDATAAVMRLFGDAAYVPTFMLGLAAQHGKLPVGSGALEDAIRLNNVAVEKNLLAFGLGRLAVCDPGKFAALTSSEKPAPTVPQTLDDLVAQRMAHLRAYQDERLAARFERLIRRVHAAEEQVSAAAGSLAMAAARSYSRLLAYKDEYEVARLLTDSRLTNEIEEQFGPGATLSYNLAPPFLGGKGSDGRPRKREFTGRIRPALRLLKSLKGLRGSWADPFGYSHERREERALIGEFEALTERVIAALRPDNVERAIHLLELASEIRGYGPVKAEAIAQYRRTSELAERDLGSVGQSHGQ